MRAARIVRHPFLCLRSVSNTKMPVRTFTEGFHCECLEDKNSKENVLGKAHEAIDVGHFHFHLHVVRKVCESSCWWPFRV